MDQNGIFLRRGFTLPPSLPPFSWPKRPSTDLLEISDMKSLVIQSNRQFFGLGLVPIKNRLTIHGLDKRL